MPEKSRQSNETNNNQGGSTIEELTEIAEVSPKRPQAQHRSLFVEMPEQQKHIGGDFEP